MTQEQSMETVAPGALVERVGALKQAEYRLVQICASTLPEHFELLYSFDRDAQLSSLRMSLPLEGMKLASISGIYGAAALYENEIHDLFNIEVEGMAVDFHGNFYQTAVKYPMGSKKAPSVPSAPREAGGAALVK